MNNRTYRSLACICLLAFSLSCKDESLDPNVAPGPGVGSQGFFLNGEDQPILNSSNRPTNISLKPAAFQNQGLKIGAKWISVDNLLKVDRIEFYVNFNEQFVNQDGVTAVATHGGATGRTAPSFVLTGLQNKTPGNLTITPAQIYELYKDATFKYNGVSDVPVFNNPANPRSATQPFKTGDSFLINWRLRTTDGNVTKSWSPSVCTEVPGYNCSIVCAVE